MTRQSLTVLLLVCAAAISPSRAEDLDACSEILRTSYMSCGSGPSFSCGSNVDCGSCCCGCCCPQWEFAGGYLYMGREHDRNSPMVYSLSTEDVALDMGDVEGDFGSGFLLSARRCDWEIRYLQISTDTTTRIPASGANQISYLGDSYFSDLVLDYETNLYSGEINYFCSDPHDTVRWSSGFRILALNEDIAATFPGFTGAIYTETRNDLYGLQLGMDADLWYTASCPFSLVCSSKAGVFYSDTSLASFPNAAAAGTLGSTTDESARGAFVGELGLFARTQLTRRLTFDAGYNLMLITGVALVGDQLDHIDQQAGQPATSHIQIGDVLYHGLMTRATFSY